MHNCRSFNFLFPSNTSRHQRVTGNCSTNEISYLVRQWPPSAADRKIGNESRLCPLRHVQTDSCNSKSYARRVDSVSDGKTTPAPSFCPQTEYPYQPTKKYVVVRFIWGTWLILYLIGSGALSRAASAMLHTQPYNTYKFANLLIMWQVEYQPQKTQEDVLPRNWLT
jgi:hypothetical protein